MISPRSLLLVTLSLLTFIFVGGSPLHAQTASQLYAQGADAYNQGDVEGAKLKLQLSLQIDRNFRPASAMLARIAAEKKAATSGSSAKTLEHTIVPVEFNNTTLTSALEFIRGKVAADSDNKLLINFVVNLPPDLANRKVTLKMERVPLLEMLRYMGDQAGVKFDRQPYAIVVTPAGDKSAAPVGAPATAATPGV